MRPKFRAFIPQLNTMIYNIDVFADGTIGIQENQLPVEYIVGFDEQSITDLEYNHIMNILACNEYVWFEEGTFVLMQYTGLKDKNNTDIYEGDIISLDDIDSVITWDDGGWQMRTSVNQGKSMAIQERTKRFEVSGNMYVPLEY